VLYGVAGGSKRNAIPVGAQARVGVPPEKVAELEARLTKLTRELATQEDPGVTVAAKPVPESRQPVTRAAHAQLRALIAGTPTGVIKATERDPSQPFVSNNLGILAETPTGVTLISMARSPSMNELTDVEARFAALAKANGAKSRTTGSTEGWEADYDAELLATCRAKYRELYGKDAKLLEIHAGLECGALKGKHEGLEVISFGPDITGAHTTSERLSIPSTQRTYALLQAVVAELHARR
jgi:dipeptidase D